MTHEYFAAVMQRFTELMFMPPQAGPAIDPMAEAHRQIAREFREAGKNVPVMP